MNSKEFKIGNLFCMKYDNEFLWIYYCNGFMCCTDKIYNGQGIKLDHKYPILYYDKKIIENSIRHFFLYKEITIYLVNTDESKPDLFLDDWKILE